MKQLPNDVVVGGRYESVPGITRYVTAVKPKGRGFYVDFTYGDGGTARESLETFRRMCNVNQSEKA